MKIDYGRTYPHGSIHRANPPRDMNRPILFYDAIDDERRRAQHIPIVDERRGLAIKRPQGKRGRNWPFLIYTLVSVAAVIAAYLWAVDHIGRH